MTPDIPPPEGAPLNEEYERELERLIGLVFDQFIAIAGISPNENSDAEKRINAIREHLLTLIEEGSEQNAKIILAALDRAAKAIDEFREKYQSLN